MRRLFACFTAFVNHIAYEDVVDIYVGMATTTAAAVVCAAAVAGFVRMTPQGNHRPGAPVKGIIRRIPLGGQNPCGTRVRAVSYGSAARAFEMVPPSGTGRTFSVRRRCRLGDVTPRGRLRLDAIARYLQDVANDDSRDAGWSDPHWWVVRRSVIDVVEFPTYLQEVDLTTWCGGLGSHWAERRTRITDPDGRVLVDAATLWVHVDQGSLQPSRVPDDVAPVLAESADGRQVGARLILRNKDFDPAAATVRGWPLRFSDFDTVGHMNNAAYWEVIEEHMSSDMRDRGGLRAVMEHVVQVDPGQSLGWLSVVGDGVSVQLVNEGTVHTAAWIGPTA